jgi:outer membrane protein assembly factor BamE (lipoprotein component of BamABCDE complex)
VRNLRLRKFIPLIVVCGSLIACSPLLREHGYVPTPDQLEALAVGVDTKDSITEAIGTPQSSGVLRDTGWYYIASTFSTKSYHAPKEISREIVSLSFDDEGVLTNVEKFGLADGRVVTLSRRVTSLPIKAPGFIQSLLADFGRFDLADVTGN